MKISIWILIVKLLDEVNGRILFCESVEHENYMEKSYDTCMLTDTTEIDSFGFIFLYKERSGVKALNFNGNKKIVFLPEKVYLSFPKLVAIDASHCSIRKENFENLEHLTTLLLFNNEIEKIYSNTIQNLHSLEYIDLGEE